MIAIYSLWNNGTCYGRFAKETWADRAAELFAQKGLPMEVECHPFVISNQKEAEECFSRIIKNFRTV